MCVNPVMEVNSYHVCSLCSGLVCSFIAGLLLVVVVVVVLVVLLFWRKLSFILFEHVFTHAR